MAAQPFLFCLWAVDASLLEGFGYQSHWAEPDIPGFLMHFWKLVKCMTIATQNHRTWFRPYLHSWLDLEIPKRGTTSKCKGLAWITSNSWECLHIEELCEGLGPKLEDQFQHPALVSPDMSGRWRIMAPTLHSHCWYQNELHLEIY